MTNKKESQSWGWKIYKRQDSFEIQTERRKSDARTSTADNCNIQHHTTPILNFLLRLLLEATWPENHHLHLHSTSSTPAFSFPADVNFGWPRKSATHSYQYKYWNILRFNFTTIQHMSNFLKWTHSYQCNYRIFYFSISHSFSYPPTQLLEHFCFLIFLIQLLNFSLVF